MLKEGVEESTGSAAGVRCSATMITSTSQVQSSSGQFEELLVPTELPLPMELTEAVTRVSRSRQSGAASSSFLCESSNHFEAFGQEVPDMDVLRSLLDSNRPCKKSISDTVGNSRPDRIEEGEEAFREAAPP